ncbi:MAG: hypothetical protein AAGH15_19785 [Myxococcota bacterium]
MTTITRPLAFALVLVGAVPVQAQLNDEPLGEVCAPTFEAAPLRVLRQLSLDVRGRIPSVEENLRMLEAADPRAELEAMREEMFASPEFNRTVMEYHRLLLWSSFDQSLVNLGTGERQLTRNRTTGLWFVNNRKARYRGNNRYICDDVPHTAFDEAGRPLPMRQPEDPGCTSGGRGGVCDIDGYVMVAPYWDPENPIKVCAFDANVVLTQPGEAGAACTFSSREATCGCGPDLQFCVPAAFSDDAGRAYYQRLQAGFTQEPLRLIERVVSEGRSYLDIFRTPETYVNGATAHYYRYNSEPNLYQVRTTSQVGYDDRVPDAELDGIEALDESWHRVERDGVHAGVLTTAAYLVRFASDRARANRFYTAFYCDPFVPQSDGIPAEEAEPAANLRERTGCADCHQELEPAAAHWGRWRNGGSVGYFDDAAMTFDAEPRAECRCGGERGSDDPEDTQGRRCNSLCEAYFVTPASSQGEELETYWGQPLAAAWLEDEDVPNVELGPVALVDTSMEVGRVAECAVRNLAEHLFHRPMDAGDLEWLAEQAAAFDGDGDASNTDGVFDWKALFERLVGDERYLGSR